MLRACTSGTLYFRTYIPPAFYGRDGSLVQPPSFEMEIESFVERINYTEQVELS
jgi:hypothetical protein